MQKVSRVLAIGFAATLIVSAFLTLEYLSSQRATPEFYVGVELAYYNATFKDVKDLVDKVKDYTNLVVIGSPEISINQTTLNETCEYLNNTGLNFIILFTRGENYTTYNHFAWMSEAKKKYGDKFLGVYRYDEPGGRQIDRSPEMLITEATNYSDASAKFTEILGIIINFYQDYADQVITSDYTLHWFDYKSNYSAVLTEFVYNNTREIAVAQCRGAARNFGRDWGTILTWKYDEIPYIESGAELFTDMVSAYKTGSKYVVIFNYPKLDKYGLLSEEHFDALKRFWDYIHKNPQDFGAQKGKVAYVMPEDYGFGLRRPDDRIWGLFEPDELSAKVWSDVNSLVEVYGFGLDIIYDEPGVVESARKRYEHLFFWNETIPVGCAAQHFHV
jgi:hypothetical protein